MFRSYFLRPVEERSVDLDMLRVKPPMYSCKSLLFFSSLLRSDCTSSHLLTRASRLDWTSIAWLYFSLAACSVDIIKEIG